MCYFQVFDKEGDDGKFVSVTVKATDQGEPSLEGVCSFTVEITDVNDNPPLFDRQVTVYAWNCYLTRNSEEVTWCEYLLIIILDSVYKTNPHTLETLKCNIGQECNSISQQVEKMMSTFRSRVLIPQKYGLILYK